MSKKKIRFGVIGVSGRGKLAKLAHDPTNETYVVAGADISTKALNEFRQTYGPDTFCSEDYKSLINRSDIDAIFITSPDYLHEEHTVTALEAGKDIYLEKPMAITIESCDKILLTAKKNKRKLYIGHNMRHMPVILKMKELIDEGRIGEVKTGWCRHFVCYGGDAYFKDWHAERRFSNGLLLQKGAHDIDVLHWLCGGYSKSVTGMGSLGVYNKVQDRHPANEKGDPTFGTTYPPLTQKGLNPIIDIEDLNMIMMKLDNGVLCTYQQCHYSPDGWRNYTIIGTEGRIENFGDDPGEVRLFNTRGGYSEYGNERFELPPATQGTHGGADPAIIKEFISYLRDECKPTISPIAARNSVAAGCVATKSLRNKCEHLVIPSVSNSIIEYFRQQAI